MEGDPQRAELFQTIDGSVRLFKGNTRRSIARWELDAGMGNLSKSSRGGLPIEKRVMLEILADQDPRNDVITAVKDEKIVGYITMVKSKFNQAWAGLGNDIAAELGCIKVSRNFRNRGITTRMLEFLFSDGKYEKNIIYSVEYSWHWDLAYNRQTKTEYHDMLLRMLRRAGFVQYGTDDPDINSDWANILTVRMGRDVDRRAQMYFIESLRTKVGQCML